MKKLQKEQQITWIRITMADSKSLQEESCEPPLPAEDPRTWARFGFN